MIRINNEPLPEPGALELSLLPSAGGPARLRVTLGFPDLSAEALAPILAAAGSGCTLSLTDPATLAPRAFQASMLACRVTVRQILSGALSRAALHLVLEEDP